MRQIIIVCYYEFKDFFLTISDLFSKKYNWNVICYPLYMYTYDKYSKLDDPQNHMIDFFKNKKPDIVLWWFSDVATSLFTSIKQNNPDTYFIMYNHSDPISLNNSYLEKCKTIDHIITCCNHSLPIYKINSKNKYVDFSPLCADDRYFKSYSITEIHHFNQKFKADISFICDSMYLDQKDQIIDRKTLIDQLKTYCKENRLTLKIYGSEIIQSFINDSIIYGGDLKYSDISAVATLSKINIVTHPDCKKKLGLCNINLFPILASGGIVLMDNINGSEMFFNGKQQTLFTFGKNDLFNKIGLIMNMYSNDISLIKIIKERSVEMGKNYSWEHFTEKIFMRYVQDKFDCLAYITTYKHKLINDPLILSDSGLTSIVKSEKSEMKNKIDQNVSERFYNVWLKHYMNGIIEIPYKVNILDTFDINNYRLKINLNQEECSDEYVYIAWKTTDMDKDYIKRGNTNMIGMSGSRINIPTSKVFELFYGFSKLFVERKLDEGINIISKVSKQNPRLQINTALSQYIDFVITE